MPGLRVGDTTRGAVSRRLLVLGAVPLIASATSALLLALSHLGAFDLPGCGWESVCSRGAENVWARVPVLGWPISYVGFAYLAGVLVAWILSRKGLSPAFHLVVNLGGIVSTAFLLLMLIEGFLCTYCLAVHLGNLAFCCVVRRQPVIAGVTLRPAIGFCVTVLSTAGALTAAQWLQEAKTRAREEQALAHWIERLAPLAAGSRPRSTAAGLVGRYPWGPERAPVRLVLFTDYQCEGCRHIDEQVRALRARRSELAISIKHFPLCSDCNGHLKRSNPHPNACWAARAAEAAGILHGIEGFWRMHEWLQETEGAFTDRDLEKGLADLGFGSKRFRATMTDLTTFVRVQADTAEGHRLGIESTPAIFINGIRLDGTFAERAIVRAVDAVLAKNPPLGAAPDDLPRHLARADVDAVAHVAGMSISRIELEQAARAEGFEPAEVDHDILCKLLDRMARERMLAVEAASRCLTVEQLNRKELDDKVPEPTSREVDEYAADVWGYRDGIPREDTRSKLSTLLRRQRLSERARKYFQELAATYGYRIALVPTRIDVSVPEDAPSRGPRNAPITLVEFADFECAFCRRNHRTVAQLLEEYGDRVHYVFVDFPLDHHPRAFPASLAARFAGEQGRYWEYFDHLMSVPGDLGDEDLQKRAAALGLDIERFKACDRSAHRAAIDASLGLGKRLGVKATPTLFVNGRRLVGMRSFSDLKSVLEEELRNASRLDHRQFSSHK